MGHSKHGSACRYTGRANAAPVLTNRSFCIEVLCASLKCTTLSVENVYGDHYNYRSGEMNMTLNYVSSYPLHRRAYELI